MHVTFHVKSCIDVRLTGSALWNRILYLPSNFLLFFQIIHANRHKQVSLSIIVFSTNHSCTHTHTLTHTQTHTHTHTHTNISPLIIIFSTNHTCKHTQTNIYSIITLSSDYTCKHTQINFPFDNNLFFKLYMQIYSNPIIIFQQIIHAHTLKFFNCLFFVWLPALQTLIKYLFHLHHDIYSI